jgi:hypothetical protein
LDCGSLARGREAASVVDSFGPERSWSDRDFQGFGIRLSFALPLCREDSKYCCLSLLIVKTDAFSSQKEKNRWFAFKACLVSQFA